MLWFLIWKTLHLTCQALLHLAVLLNSCAQLLEKDENTFIGDLTLVGFSKVQGLNCAIRSFPTTKTLSGFGQVSFDKTIFLFLSHRAYAKIIIWFFFIDHWTVYSVQSSSILFVGLYSVHCTRIQLYALHPYDMAFSLSGSGGIKPAGARARCSGRRGQTTRDDGASKRFLFRDEDPDPLMNFWAAGSGFGIVFFYRIKPGTWFN